MLTAPARSPVTDFESALLNNPRMGELVINLVFSAFDRHWGFTPKAC